MISRFFRKKGKPSPKTSKPVAKAKTTPKKEPKKTKGKEKSVNKPVEAPIETSPSVFSPPPLKPGKTITAEGWKRLMMRRSGKK